MKKSLTAGLSAVALVASAASVALVSSSTANAQEFEGTPSSAFGIESVGLIPIDAMPYVESADGELVTDQLAEIPGDPLLNVGLIEVEAANNYAKATVAGITVGDGLLAQLPEELTDALGEVCAGLEPLLDAGGELTGTLNEVLGQIEAGVIDPLNEGTQESPIDIDLLNSLGLGELLPEDLSGLCDALTGGVALVSAGVITAECNGDTGTSSIADLSSLLGLPLDVGSEPNSTAGIEGVLEITANRQTNNADGTFTVDALVVDLFDGELVLTEASATCGEVTAVTDVPNGPGPDAPTPVPGPGDLPVPG
jgi:hypothetical protein